MAKVQNYLIGRSASADIVLADSSVSRHHAELTLSKDGRCYLTDCRSTRGSFVSTKGAWVKVRQEFIEQDDPIKLGEVETSVRKLRALIKRNA